MNYSAFINNHLFTEGDLTTVIVAVKTAFPDKEALLVETETCKRLEINWHGNTDDVLQRVEALSLDSNGTSSPSSAPVKKRGRPKLGVTSKEVTLLPRHWEWLATQSGGASVTLRKLVDQARKATTVEDDIKNRQKQLFGFINIFAEQLDGFEEAIRALYRQDVALFNQHTQSWPIDIRTFCEHKLSIILALKQNSISQ